MDSHQPLELTDLRRRSTRRQFLGALTVATVIGVSGCSGSDGDGSSPDGSSDGGSDDQSSDGSSDGQSSDGSSDGQSNDGSSDDEQTVGSANRLACSDLTAGYAAFPSGERPLFVDFEIPAVLADAAEYRAFTSQDTVTSVRPLAVDGSEQFHLFVSQMADGRESPPGVLDIHETVSEIEFNGETRPVVKIPPRDDSPIEQLTVNVPYDSGDGTRYHHIIVQLEVENASSDGITDACAGAIDEAALHVMESLSPNPDTTFGEDA